MNFYIMWANHDVARNYWNVHRYKEDNSLLWKGAIDWPNFKIIVKRIIEQYFKCPNYFKINGEPVFSIFGLNNLIKTFGSLEETRNGLKYFREEVKKAGFPNVHIQLIANGTPNDNFLNQIETLNINSLTIYQWGGSQPEDYIQWGTEAFDRLEKWSKIVSIPYFPNVSVGWDDTPRFPLKTQKDVVHLNQSPETFAAYLQKAKEYCDKHPSQPKLITIYAWNEWVEGAYLLPDIKYGFKYLNAIKRIILDKEYDKY